MGDIFNREESKWIDEVGRGLIDNIYDYPKIISSIREKVVKGYFKEFIELFPKFRLNTYSYHYHKTLYIDQLLNLANEYLTQQKYSKAIELLDKAINNSSKIRLNSRLLSAIKDKVKILKFQDRTQDAIVMLQKAKEKYSDLEEKIILLINKLKSENYQLELSQLIKARQAEIIDIKKQAAQEENQVKKEVDAEYDAKIKAAESKLGSEQAALDEATKKAAEWVAKKKEKAIEVKILSKEVASGSKMKSKALNIKLKEIAGDKKVKIKAIQGEIKALNKKLKMLESAAGI